MLFQKSRKYRPELKERPVEHINSDKAALQSIVQAAIDVELFTSATESKGDLRLLAKFDKTESGTSDEITCHVEVERVGFRGYGMMLAEIGLPPGTDVDRKSLETAMASSDWSLTQYDVLPDRVAVYLWPRAGGVKFDFKFRPRFALKAKSAASIIYDYYNPEERAVLQPAVFKIR